MSDLIKLSLEQEASIAQYRITVADLDREQVQIRLIALHRAMLLQDNYYKPKVAAAWGISF